MSENPINKCGFHNRKMMSESRIFLNRTTIDDRQRVVCMCGGIIYWMINDLKTS